MTLESPLPSCIISFSQIILETWPKYLEGEEMAFDVGEFKGRKLELSMVDEYIQEEGSGFLHLRGRRRIGKSWFLKRAMKKYKKCFYFQGRDDSTNRSQMSDFGKEWDQFIGKKKLGKIRTAELAWEDIFSEIEDYAQKLERPLILILDEVQWLAKKGSGFISKLKEAWIGWETTNNIKVIVSGSSNKFFEDGKSAETKILRGLRTFSDITIGPFCLLEIKKYIFPRWSEEEICLVYMITGGVPYYLKRILKNTPFIRSINEAFFTRKSIFFNEVDELLMLEFNNNSIENVKKVLSTLGQEGKTIASICSKVNLHEKSIRDILSKLINYKLIYVKEIEDAPAKANRHGAKYIMKDCFLNFYFQILKKHEGKIKTNKSKNIFGEKVIASNGFYIENFTGKAFELLIQLVLEEGMRRKEESGIIKKMGLSHFNYKVGYYWEEGITEVDIIVKAPDARESKIIEAKWISKKASGNTPYIDQVLGKEYRAPKRYTIEYYLVLSRGWTAPVKKKAKDEEVALMTLKDLF